MRTPRRRRLEKKTDYKARLALLKSQKPRIVIRKTNRHIIVQVVETDIAEDKTICSVNSKHLLSKGWPKEKSGSLKNLQAAYLTGFLLGRLAKEKKVSEAILDSGMNRNIKKSRIYSALKGVKDAGFSVLCDEEVLPTDEELNSKADFADIIKKITK